MAEFKKNDQITGMNTDFAQWYTDVVVKSEMVSYSNVKGCVILRPYGYAVWENIQRILDAKFKELGHENVAMPMFIPESLLDKEKDHVEGFAPEVAWVTHGGSDKLQERLCVRPTSETLFCDHYAEIIHSYRDLPKLYNQWVSVVRWEKNTRPFLRTREFYWQEGHTAHASAEEAEAETQRMLNVYADFCRDALAIPVIKGQKTDKEKFAGARATYTIEALMHDGQALQSGTSHDFGDGFAKAFNIQFADKDNQQKYVHQTSWGMSTRIIGAIIMVHGDNNGLVLPPAVAPIQVAIVPIQMQKPGVADKAKELEATLKAAGYRVRTDLSDKMPGWKFSEYEMKGVPLRIEIGPRDIENNCCVIVRRDNGEKQSISLDNLAETVAKTLAQVHDGMYAKALAHMEEHTFSATDMNQMNDIISTHPGFVKAMWCGDRACEDKIKEMTGATSRCIPFQQEHVGDTCVCCGKPAAKMVVWGRAY